MTDITKSQHLKQTKVIITFSGGKDSLACLIWAKNNPEYKNAEMEAVFCDTGWEHEATYKHINDVIKKIGIKLITIKSKKYNGFVDLAVQKGRFPSAKARFCTEELKSKPMIDYVLEQRQNLIIVQGIRKDESKSRSIMNESCTLFKHYTKQLPSGKFHNYRKKDVLLWKQKYNDDIIRPVFHWSGSLVMKYIVENGFKPNPLYYQGAMRVGCYPCIMCRHSEINNMMTTNPEYVTRLMDAENRVGRTFFAPEYIPKWASQNKDEKTGKTINTVLDVTNYIQGRNSTLDMFEEDGEDRSCMSYYGLCE